ncbi:MAG: YceI family protein [Actinomycetota bacterium]|nr:YceI family protein [Actinomycetota bacterium]
MSTSETTSTPTRVIDGTELPLPGTWVIDPGHAQVGFLGRHLMFTKVRGRFRDVAGSIQVAEDPNQTAVDVTIDMASVESGNPTRDDHLRSGELFDVERFPRAEFHGRARNWQGRTGQLVGDLTVKGITRPVVLEADYLGLASDPWGGNRIIFTASATINREDWGVDWNMALDAGGLLVSKEIHIELELEAVHQTETTTP